MLVILKDLKIPLGTGANRMTTKDQYVAAIVKSGWSQRTLDENGKPLSLEGDDGDGEEYACTGRVATYARPH